ncbi:MAG: heavy metal translocating P-type ATPase metal-binding domain-containing protein [Chitinophagaceae bacterium]|nr:heavy metal translocating P-type ATPase metal-binding domain-containing protein [Chitinophagaceae bacterium]
MNLISTTTAIPVKCFHCGDPCPETITLDDKSFCCSGCKQVYALLNENNLCGYYNLDENPGIKVRGKFNDNRFAYLDDAEINRKLLQFSSDTQSNITFSLPQMHCSSCVYLLENLHRIEPGVIRSQTNFQRKEVFIVFNPQLISLRKVVELLAFIGYEPDISLKDSGPKTAPAFNRNRLYQIGVAGFCFANIMMLSFPEYFSSGNIEQNGLKETFTWLNLILSLPVLFYSASGFFVSAWKSLRQGYLNIDAPIALAIIVAFGRSYYEIISGTGAGFLDSGSGIVFFMLVGRWFQDKTYDSLSFDRDYQSYFPLGVTVISGREEKNIPVTKLQIGDRILIRNEEMVPADAILIRGNGNVDYSFVSGENTPIQKNTGDLVYAGGKQLGSALELEVVNEVSQSYITRLWNNDVFHNTKNREKSFIHPWSRYFTIILFAIAAIAVVYWWFVEPANILPVLTAVLLVACPCSLLLSATFTYGNMVRLFGRNKLYVKNSGVIEYLSKVDAIVFDKTGTMTEGFLSEAVYTGTPLTDTEKGMIRKMAEQSLHPLSKIIAASVNTHQDRQLRVEQFKEYAGMGMEGMINQVPVKLGSSAFIAASDPGFISYDTGTHVHLSINGTHLGRFSINNHYRSGLSEMVNGLRSKGYSLHVLSGDNDTEKANLEKIFGTQVPMRFGQSPTDKLEYIKSLQQQDHRVLMLGDGLNDAGALMQSQAGIAVSENTARFTPACDAILDGSQVNKLDRFLRFACSGKRIITASFILSILYNIIGLSFAVSSALSPLVAAILMPASSISIVIFVTLLSNLSARKKGL